MTYAERAAEMADTATDGERYFILGSYHGFRDELEEAAANYRALLQVDPDHFWGVGNLIIALRKSGRGEEALPFALHRAKLRPNSFLANGVAALLIDGGVHRVEDPG